MEYMGKPCSEETKKKLSAIHKGKSYHNKGFQKGHKDFLDSKTHKMVGEKLKAMGHRPKKYFAENHPKWLGGKISYLRKVAKKRDDYTCQKCGFKDVDIMQVDHVKPRALYPELYEVLENLLTLCPNCHARKTIFEKRSKLWKTGRPQNHT